MLLRVRIFDYGSGKDAKYSVPYSKKIKNAENKIWMKLKYIKSTQQKREKSKHKKVIIIVLLEEAKENNKIINCVFFNRLLRIKLLNTSHTYEYVFKLKLFQNSKWLRNEEEKKTTKQNKNNK